MTTPASTPFCPDLEPDEWKLKYVTDVTTGETSITDEYNGSKRLEDSKVEKYLGDLISHDGSNSKNIMARKAKGAGIVDQIMGKLRGTFMVHSTLKLGLS